jgi:hypothetical protein
LAKLVAEELHNLHSSPSIIRIIRSMRMRWAGHVGCMVEKRSAYRILVGKPEGEISLGRWLHNVKRDLIEMVWGAMGYIDLAEYRDQWRALMNIECWEVLE